MGGGIADDGSAGMNGVMPENWKSVVIGYSLASFHLVDYGVVFFCAGAGEKIIWK